jgi:hypothetical protein
LVFAFQPSALIPFPFGFFPRRLFEMLSFFSVFFFVKIFVGFSHSKEQSR